MFSVDGNTFSVDGNKYTVNGVVAADIYMGGEKKGGKLLFLP